MSVPLKMAKEVLERGRLDDALDYLRKAEARARETGDPAEFAEIVAVAQEICSKGSSGTAAGARQLIDAITGGVEAVVSPLLSQLPALPITTGNDLPGYTITEIIGPVFGMTVRSRNVLSQLGAKLRGASVGGELKGMTEALEQSRFDVMQRMEEKARRIGADGVIAMRFDVSEMADVWTEVCAYGTAVRAQKLS